MSDTHTLIITADAEDPTDADLFTFEIRCPEVSDACRMWVECDIATCHRDNADLGEAIVHGKDHKLFPGTGTWCVPTDTCYLTVAEDMGDAAAFLASGERLGAGEYEVGHDFEEGSVADLHLTTDGAAAR